MSARGIALRERPRVDVRSVVYHAFVIGFGFVMLYPLLWMVASSLKPADEVFSTVTSLIPGIPRWTTTFRVGRASAASRSRRSSATR